jgi:hypothetical protein
MILLIYLNVLDLLKKLKSLAIKPPINGWDAKILSKLLITWHLITTTPTTLNKLIQYLTPKSKITQKIIPTTITI